MGAAFFFGGEVVYPTFDPATRLNSSVTLSNGNLTALHNSSGGGSVSGEVAIPASGKWYFEMTIDSVNETMVGLWAYNASFPDSYYSNPGIFYYKGALKFVDGSNAGAYGASYTTGDVIGVAIDTDANTVAFYKNNVNQGSISYDAAGMFPCFAKGTSLGAGQATADFGQNGFTYTPPSGHQPLTL